MLGAHVVGILVIIAWSGGLSAVVFGILRLARVLQVDTIEQDEGTDLKVMSPKRAYSGGGPWSDEAAKV
jgi:ammonia channel protein AmtB